MYSPDSEERLVANSIADSCFLSFDERVKINTTNCTKKRSFVTLISALCPKYKSIYIAARNKTVNFLRT